MKYIIAFPVILILAYVIILPGIREFLRQNTNKPDRPHRPAEIHKREKFWICESCGQEFRLLDSNLPPATCPTCGAARDENILTDDAETGTIIRTCPACAKRVEMLDGQNANFCPYCGRQLERE